MFVDSPGTLGATDFWLNFTTPVLQQASGARPEAPPHFSIKQICKRTGLEPEFLLNQCSTYLHHLIPGWHHQKDTLEQNDPLLHTCDRHLKHVQVVVVAKLLNAWWRNRLWGIKHQYGFLNVAHFFKPQLTHNFKQANTLNLWYIKLLKWRSCNCQASLTIETWDN